MVRVVARQNGDASWLAIDPTAAGLHEAILRIANDDVDESASPVESRAWRLPAQSRDERRDPLPHALPLGSGEASGERVDEGRLGGASDPVFSHDEPRVEIDLGRGGGIRCFRSGDGRIFLVTR